MAISTTFTLKFAGAAVEKGLARVQSAFKSLGGVASKAGKMLLSPFAALTAMLGAGALTAGLISFVKGSSAAASSVESLTTQFTTLLGSATAAQERMEEITKFAATTPFEISELAATSKLLEVMGGKLISTGDGLRLVGDAAAMAGQPIGEVGLHIGRLFSAITSGTSAGESVNRLQELGLITGATKIKFEELAAAQKKGTAATLSGEKALKLLQGVMSKAQGGMAALSNTTEGKLSNLRDNLDQLKVSFGKGFNDGFRVALDAANTKLPQLMAKFAEFGKLIGKTISDAVNGDLTRLIAVGELIGTAIAGGVKIGLKAGGREAAQSFWKMLEDINPIRNTEWGMNQPKFSEAISQNKGEAARQEVADFVEKLKSQYSVAASIPTALPQKTGPHPNMKGVSYAPAGYNTNMTDEKGYRIMFDIKTGIDGLNQKLAPQP
jgi:hypothetical protein